MCENRDRVYWTGEELLSISVPDLVKAQFGYLIKMVEEFKAEIARIDKIEKDQGYISEELIDALMEQHKALGVEIDKVDEFFRQKAGPQPDFKPWPDEEG